jgi:DNA gyrase subunit A
MSEHIIEKESVRMYEQDQAKYSVVANRRRAIPEVRDGLKPIQRRVCYGAFRAGFTAPNKRTKTADLVGTIMGKLHAHGDSSISGAIETLVAWFKCKYPLMYGYGNWGNVLGSGAASMRYTETALSDFGYEVVCEDLHIAPNVVNWLDTYKRDGDKEPEFMPVKIPLLLINGTFGIGVGMAVNIPSHNLGEVIDVTVGLMKDPNMKFCLIPDMCQACDLIGDDWQGICDSGVGAFKVRGHILTEQDKKGNYILRIVSLPDQVNTTTVYEKILEMVEKKELPMVKDIYNSLEGEYPNVIIHLRPGSDPEFVKQVLYAKTSVQQSYSVNFEVVDTDGINIRRFSYRDYLLTFIDQRMNVKFRIYCSRLQQAMTRHHRLDAYVKVMESGEIETIINMIRKQDTIDDNVIMEYIIKKCKVTDLQAKFIMETQVSRLSMGHLKRYKEERTKLEQDISIFEAAVTDDGSIIKQEIIQELLSIKEKYNNPRLCKVVDTALENQIPKGTFKIVITESNFIRKIPDVDRVNVIRKDNPRFILRVDNAENIILFDNKGKCFILPIHRIPITDKSDRGTDIRMIIKNLTSDIISVFYEPIFKKIIDSGNKHYMTVVTKNNYIKKMDIEDFLHVSPSGLLYTKLKDMSDEVVNVSLIAHSLDVVACSGKKALRMQLADIPCYKRSSNGCTCMKGSEIITGLTPIYPDSSDIVVITKNGKLNRFNAAMLQCHKRATGGSKVIKLDATDEIHAIVGANETDVLKILTTEGTVEIPMSEIKSKSTLAAGQKFSDIKGVVVRVDVIRGQ